MEDFKRIKGFVYEIGKTTKCKTTAFRTSFVVQQDLCGTKNWFTCSFYYFKEFPFKIDTSYTFVGEWKGIKIKDHLSSKIYYFNTFVVESYTKN